MRIIGVMLVRDEDIYVASALRNALSLCDEIWVCENQSRDDTFAVLRGLANECPDRIKLHSIRNTAESHEMLRPLAGTKTWVFGVDGDEVYDPEGLSAFRRKLERGDYADQWAIFGNVLNVRRWDEAARTAWGHLAPPCRSMTKLYNFQIISDWSGRGCIERLHGGTIAFHPGYHSGLRCNLHEKTTWEESIFRCLHLCFLRRSSLESQAGAPRKNIMDRRAWTLGKVMAKIRGRLTGHAAPDWKEDRYGRGPLVEKSYLSFFPRGLPHRS